MTTYRAKIQEDVEGTILASIWESINGATETRIAWKEFGPTIYPYRDTREAIIWARSWANDCLTRAREGLLNEVIK